MVDPSLDGTEHVNVYSKGKTQLGRLLSNFAFTPFTHPHHGKFNTVEGFWYWLMTGDERLRELLGWECKALGKTLAQLRGPPTKEELYVSYRCKVEQHPEIRELLRNNRLPFEHYYVYSGRVVQPKEFQWTVDLWSSPGLQ